MLRNIDDKYFNDPKTDAMNKTLFVFAGYNVGPPARLRKGARRRLDPTSGLATWNWLRPRTSAGDGHLRREHHSTTSPIRWRWRCCQQEGGSAAAVGDRDMQVRIRDVTPQDAPAGGPAAELWRWRTIAEEIASFRGSIVEPDAFVAESDAGEVVGFAELSIRADVAGVEGQRTYGRLYVLPGASAGRGGSAAASSVGAAIAVCGVCAIARR